MIAARDPMPHVGENEVLLCIDSCDIRTMRAQRGTVAKPLLSVKRVTEAGQFVGFCEQG